MTAAPTLDDPKTASFESSPASQRIIDWVQALPPMPEVATRAMRLIDDPNASAEQIASALSRDATLAAQILRAANSAATGRSQQVGTLQEAVHVAGFRYVKGIVMASVTRRWNKDFTPIARLVWERSIGTAVGTRVVLSQASKRDTDHLYMAGLLHNLGQVVMLSHPEIGPKYPAVLQAVTEKRITFRQAEEEVLGFSHPMIGALVAKKWGFPPELCQAILHYDDSVAWTQDATEKAALKLASLLSIAAGVGSIPDYPIETEELTTLAMQAGFPADHLDDQLAKVTETTKTDFTAEASLYS